MTHGALFDTLLVCCSLCSRVIVDSSSGAWAAADNAIIVATRIKYRCFMALKWFK